MSKVAFIRCKNVLYEIEDEEAQNEIANIYTKEEVNNLISAFSRANFTIVTQLPTENISPTTIYLLPIDPKNLSEGYNEFIYTNGKWEIIGVTKSDFSQYYSKEEIDNLLSGKQNSIEIDTELSEKSDNPIQNKAVTIALNSKVGLAEFMEALAKKADKSEIRTKLSQMEDDIGIVHDDNYIHTDNNFTNEDKEKLEKIDINAKTNVQSDWEQNDNTQDDFIKNKPDLSKVAQTGKYSDLYGVPTVLSNFINDTLFINKATRDLMNYYLKDDLYTKDEVNELIGKVSSISFIIVDSLPTEDIKDNVIYLKPSDDDEDVYEEYVYNRDKDKWARIGTSKVDLSNYYTKDEVDTKIDKKADSFDVLDLNKGGTGATTSKEASFNLFSDINEAITDIDDGDYLITAVTTPNQKTGPFNKRSVSHLWSWIVGKISTVLGLNKDNYGGTAAKAIEATKATQDGDGNVISDRYATKEEIPTSLPANDVPEWAKAETKPTYTPQEVGAASASHNHSSSDINAMSGYSIPDKYSEIAETDSLNNAIGKLERAITDRPLKAVTSVRVQGSSPIVSSVSAAQTESLDTVISLADSYGDIKNPYGVKNAGQVLIAPTDKDGAPTFRNLLASDIPTLNQNTTGNAATATNATNDGLGRNIANTYALLSDLPNVSNFISNAGASPNLGDGTVVTQPSSSAAALSIRTTLGTSRDAGIFYLSQDSAYIANSADSGYVFGVFDTDKTANMSSVDTASFAVLQNMVGSNMAGVLTITPTTGNWTEGIRIKPYSSWSTILLGGNDLTSDVGTSVNSWSIHNHNGNFYISRGGSSSSPYSMLSCENNNWRLTTSLSLPGLNVGNRVTDTVPSSGYVDINRVTLYPPYHTGGAWNVNIYDNINTSYFRLLYGDTERFYLDHNGNAKINGGILRQYSNGIEIGIGALNGDWVHIYNNTNDKPFIFNTSVYSMGGYYPYPTGSNCTLGNSSSEFSTGYVRQLYARHLDSSRNYTGDSNLYLQYNTDGPTYFNGSSYYIKGGYYNGKSKESERWVIKDWNESWAALTSHNVDEIINTVSGYGLHYSPSGWAWANSVTINLYNGVSNNIGVDGLSPVATIDTQKYYCCPLSNNTISNTWSHGAIMFIPMYSDSKKIYIQKWTTSQNNRVSWTLQTIDPDYAASAGGVAWGNISGKPSFFSGNYNDLSNKPTIDKTTVFAQISRGNNLDVNTSGYWGAMWSGDIDGATRWWHVISMDWTGNDVNNWISQFAIPTQSGGVPHYRRNNYGGLSIGSSTWHSFITSENIGDQAVSYAEKASVAYRIPTSQNGSEVGTIWIA